MGAFLIGITVPSKQRGAGYEARVEKLRNDTRQSLKVGTKKEDVFRFFAENGIPAALLDDEISGTVHTIGCAPSGCGSDDALLALRVKVDKAGTTVSDPLVGAIYTNCL